MELLLRGADVTPRERELMRAVPEMDTIASMLGAGELPCALPSVVQESPTPSTPDMPDSQTTCCSSHSASTEQAISSFIALTHRDTLSAGGVKISVPGLARATQAAKKGRRAAAKR